MFFRHVDVSAVSQNLANESKKYKWGAKQLSTMVSVRNSIIFAFESRVHMDDYYVCMRVFRARSMFVCKSGLLVRMSSMRSCISIRSINSNI